MVDRLYVSGTIKGLIMFLWVPQRSPMRVKMLHLHRRGLHTFKEKRFLPRQKPSTEAVMHFSKCLCGTLSNALEKSNTEPWVNVFSCKEQAISSSKNC